MVFQTLTWEDFPTTTTTGGASATGSEENGEGESDGGVTT